MALDLKIQKFCFVTTCFWHLWNLCYGTAFIGFLSNLGTDFPHKIAYGDLKGVFLPSSLSILAWSQYCKGKSRKITSYFCYVAIFQKHELDLNHYAIPNFICHKRAFFVNSTSKHWRWHFSWVQIRHLLHYIELFQLKIVLLTLFHQTVSSTLGSMYLEAFSEKWVTESRRERQAQQEAATERQ